jgi:E3 ubiquitin-protein ligase HUWE1
MYDGDEYEEYADEIDYGEEISEDGEEDVSDEDEELGEMGGIEGLPPNSNLVEVIMGENDDDDNMDDDDESDDEDGDEDDELGSNDIEEVEDHIDGDGPHPIEEDGDSIWQSETDDEEGEEDDEADFEGQAQDLDEGHIAIENNQIGHFSNLNNLMQGVLDSHDDFDGDELGEFDEHNHYVDIDEVAEEDGMLGPSGPITVPFEVIVYMLTGLDEEEEDEVDEEDYYYEPPGLARESISPCAQSVV